MTAIVEIEISIRLERDAGEGRHGISSHAEVVVDECFYVQSKTADGALAAAEGALHDAVHKCEVAAGVAA